jgi:hypothetical protein
MKGRIKEKWGNLTDDDLIDHNPGVASSTVWWRTWRKRNPFWK